MGCQEARGSNEFNCCCNDCEHNRIEPIAGYCCNCLPRDLCVLQAIDNDEYTLPGSQSIAHIPGATLDHNGGPVEFYEAIRIKSISGVGSDLSEQDWFMSTSLRRGSYTFLSTPAGTGTSSYHPFPDNRQCYWLIQIVWVDYDNLLSTTEFFYFPVHDYDSTGTGNDATGVTCLTGDPDNHGLNSIVFDYTYKPSSQTGPDPVEFLSIHEVDVTFYIKKPIKQIMPLGEDTSGCKTILCSNCECYPKCVCITYDIEFFIPDEDHPNDPIESVGHIRRSIRTCWDEDVSDYGGWYAQFTGFVNGGCGDGIETTFEFEADEDGTCKLILTTGDLEIEGQFHREEATTPLDNSANACEFIHHVWEWGTADLDTGTATGGYRTGSGTASLPLVVRKIILQTDACDAGCSAVCCEDIPDELTAVIWTDDDCMAEAAEITLYRSECHSSSYYGLEEDVIDWNCDVHGEGHGSGSVEVRFACINCKHSWKDNICECDCNSDWNSVGTAQDGCHTLTSIRFFDWDCTGTAASLCTHSQIGARSGDQSECGTISGEIFESGCDPIFADFGSLAVQGINLCCDSFNVIITE